MSDIKATGSSSSCIQLDVDVAAKVAGKSTITKEDGTVVYGPASQKFVRIEDELSTDDWLINPSTKETHKVISVEGNVVVITTNDGSTRTTFDAIKDILLKVVPDDVP